MTLQTQRLPTLDDNAERATGTAHVSDTRDSTPRALAARPTAASPLLAMSKRYGIDALKLLEVLKATVIKATDRHTPTNEEIAAFCIVAEQYGLSPFTREIHAFCDSSRGIVPIVGIDGWTKIANNTGQMNGVSFAIVGEPGQLECTCTIHVKGREHPVVVTEYLVECKRNTPPWNQMPRRMLRHRSFIQCARVAFGFGGIYDEDEAKDIMRGDAPMTGVRRLDDLNAAVVPHPTSTTQVIDTSTANVPSTETAEQIINNAPRAPEHQQDAVGDVEAQAPEPAADLALDSEGKLIAFAESVASETQIDPKLFTAAIKQLRLSDGIGGGKRADTLNRNRIAAAMQAGSFDWQTAKIIT